MKKTLPYILPLFRSFLFITGGLIFALLTKQTLEESSNYWPLLCSLYNLITILVLILVCRYEKIKYKDLLRFNLKGVKISHSLKHILIMLLIGIIGMIGLSFIFYNGLPEFLIKPIIPWLAIVNFYLLPVTIVLAEMPLYFGYSLKRINKGKYFGLIYVVFFYALQHSFIPLLVDLEYMLYRFLSFLPLALFVGYRFLKDNDLTSSLIGHGVMDLSTSVQVIIMSLL
jgi:hypothetical protein